MLVEDLPIPQHLKERYARDGISELYPPQAECIHQGVLEGKNLLIAIPTASGKTLVAEMAMHHAIQGGGKCLYIVPLKALASEKFDEFSDKKVRVGIATGDLDRRDDLLGRNDIIVATSEKVDSLVRNNARWIGEISLLVIDEIHLIDSPDRGPTLEMVIAKMRSRNPSMQVIGLSATIGNPERLAGWLDAGLVTSGWRPVDLRQGVFFGDNIHFRDKKRAISGMAGDSADLNLCLDTITEGGQCLVFVSSRKNAEAFAKRTARVLKREDPDLAIYAGRIRKAAETDMGKVLADCILMGSAFHHAGLSHQERSIVEEGFRKGSIKVISSTPTLAAGLNLPARRVIVRDHYRFVAGEGMLPIPASEYHQMAGRAGRPRLDPYGEAVLIAKDQRQVEELFDWYIEAPPEEVHSKIAEPAALYTHVLSLVASGFARDRQELASFLNRTFYVHEHRQGRLIQRAADAALAFLATSGMIAADEDHLRSTGYGSLVSKLYIDPRSAAMIVEALRKNERYTDIGLLQVVCSTPDMPKLYVRNSEITALDRMIQARAEDLWFPQLPEEDSPEPYYRSLKTALLLSDWTDELSDAKICERYAVGPGDIHGMVESVTWLLHATSELARMFAPGLQSGIREYEICVKNGSRRELLPLIRLRGVGRVRARRLFNNRITTPEEILDRGIEEVSRILGSGIAEAIFRQIQRKTVVTTPEEAMSSGSGQSTLDNFGGQ